MDYRDYISRQAVLDLMIHIWGENFSGDSAMQESIDAIRVLPSVTPQEPKSEWEQDHEILKAYSNGADEVLDKIRAEIKGMYRVILKGTSPYDWAVRWNDCLDEVLEIIDKYKAESEG